jgi:type IV pilus assembly protein PilB
MSPITLHYYIHRKRKTLQEIFTSNGIINEEEYKKMLSEAQSKNTSVIQLLVDKGVMKKESILPLLSKEWEVESIDLSKIDFDTDIVRLIPESLARKNLIVPFGKKNNKLLLAISDPRNIFAIEDVKLRTGYDVEPYIALPKDILETIDKAYGETTISNLISSIQTAQNQALTITHEKITQERVEIAQIDAEAPEVERIVNAIILTAYQSRASDIHIEPFERKINVRYRIDGVLQDAPINFPLSYLPAIISRIKIMTVSMDITERRRPQDGRIKLTISGKPIELRVNIIPTIFGESCVIRILDRTSLVLDLEELGFTPENLEKFKKSLSKPYGLILVCGPTGSGKTTTLYSALNTINSQEKKILTIEDPVEYNLDGIIQLNVNPEIGLNFASALRAFLRQDPDIIMVGEIRDNETATIAMEAALTGHLVFSTLHTNDAPSAIARLSEMGIPNYLIASSIECILAQRLIRKICPNCHTPIAPQKELIELLVNYKIDLVQTAKGQGCKICNFTGFKGRTGIYELLTIDEEMREFILKETAVEPIRNYTKTKGIRTLFEDGLIKVAKGITTYEQVLAVCQ